MRFFPITLDQSKPMNASSRENFQPDFGNVQQVLNNQRPRRLPLYEHHIDLPFISKALGKEIVLQGNKRQDYVAHYREGICFWREMTYDAFDYEAAICEIFPGHGAILGGAGPIQTREDVTDSRLVIESVISH